MFQLKDYIRVSVRGSQLCTADILGKTIRATGVIEGPAVHQQNRRLVRGGTRRHLATPGTNLHPEFEASVVRERYAVVRDGK